MGCSDIWLSIILGVSVRVFLGQSNTEIPRAEQTALPDVGGLVQSAEGPNRTEELREREPRLLVALEWDTVFSCVRDSDGSVGSSWMSVLPASGWKVFHQLSWQF